MAEIMSEQEASGFRFDVEAAERVRAELQEEADNIQAEIAKRYIYVPGKVYTPKRANKTKGYVAGAPMTKLLGVQSNQPSAHCLGIAELPSSSLYQSD